MACVCGVASVCDGATELWHTTHRKPFTMSADDLIPILCYVLIRSRVRAPFSELHLVAEFMPVTRPPARPPALRRITAWPLLCCCVQPEEALGHAGYMLTSMQIVTQHVNKVYADRKREQAKTASMIVGSACFAPISFSFRCGVVACRHRHVRVSGQVSAESVECVGAVRRRRHR